MTGLFSRLRPRPPASQGIAAGSRPASGVTDAPDVLEAERLAAGLPPLSVDATRIAPWSGIGVHGRRQAGHGDSFWQYRPVLPGEPVNRIDWRQSARSERAYVRETERESAQTFCLWLDRTPSMRWRSDAGLPQKAARAGQLALAAAAMLLRAGERVRVIGGDAPVTATTRQRLPAVAAALTSGGREAGEPAETLQAVPRDATVLLFGDFLDPPETWATRLATLAARPATALLVRVLDPAELSLPWRGRVRFEGLEGEAPLLVPRTDDLHDAYAAAMATQTAALSAIAARFGLPLLTHRTGERAEHGVRAIYQTLAGHHATTAPPDPAPTGPAAVLR